MLCKGLPSAKGKKLVGFKGTTNNIFGVFLNLVNLLCSKIMVVFYLTQDLYMFRLQSQCRKSIRYLKFKFVTKTQGETALQIRTCKVLLKVQLLSHSHSKNPRSSKIFWVFIWFLSETKKCWFIGTVFSPNKPSSSEP